LIKWEKIWLSFYPCQVEIFKFRTDSRLPKAKDPSNYSKTTKKHSRTLQSALINNAQ
jgi:hypothetical protein